MRTQKKQWKPNQALSLRKKRGLENSSHIDLGWGSPRMMPHALLTEPAGGLQGIHTACCDTRLVAELNAGNSAWQKCVCVPCSLQNSNRCLIGLTS